MFCPACHAEYRSGFTHCTDCRVDLVEELPQDDSPAAYVVLWRGEEMGFHDLLLEELDRSSIRYADIPLAIYLRGAADPFNLRFSPQLGFVVSVVSSDLPVARHIFEELLGREIVDTPHSEAEDESTESDSTDTPPLPLRWDPNLATLEIWSGNDLNRIRFLDASLRENGIPSRIVEDDPNKPCLLICPEDATRAREIIHQISDAAVPQTSLTRSTGYVWHDEPVRSYLLAWLPGLIYLAFVVFFSPLGARSETGFPFTSVAEAVFAFVYFVSEVGTLWMAYQAIRYEVRPFRFVLLAFLPLSCFWYYYERYSRRRGAQRLPIAVRLRMSPPPTA